MEKNIKSKKIIICLVLIFVLISFIIKTRDSTIKKDSISLCMLGDLLMHKKILEYSYDKINDKYNFDYIFENMDKYIKQYDLKIINEEVLISGRKYGISGYPIFNSPFELTDSIAKVGFNFILKATNHVNDKNELALKDDLNNWKNKYNNIIITGAYLNEEESKKISYFIKNNIKIALLNYSYGSNIKLNHKYLMNQLNYDQVKNDIEKAKNEGAEFIIVCPHWGIEYVLEEDNYQKYWAKNFFELGVNLVIGTHPHVIQPVKIIEDKNKKMYIFYSLGNFINSTSSRTKNVFLRFLGGMAHVILEKDRNNKVIIKEIKFIPLITHINKDKKATTYKVKDYSREMAEKNFVGIEYDKSFSYDLMISTFKKVIDTKFLDFNL